MTDERADATAPDGGPASEESTEGPRADEERGTGGAEDTDTPPAAVDTEGEAAETDRAEPADTAEPVNTAEPADTADRPDAVEGGAGEAENPAVDSDVPADVKQYTRFSKIDGATYDRANDFLRDRTYITAREWAMARLCADFRTETGVEMTKIGENLPELVPFMTDTYTPQAVNQARASFEEKVRKAGATFLYGAMCDFFTAEELDDVMYEATEVAKFLLEVEGVDLAVEEELAAEDRISSVMREVRESSAALRHDEVACPECGHHFDVGEVSAHHEGVHEEGDSEDEASEEAADDLTDEPTREVTDEPVDDVADDTTGDVADEPVDAPADDAETPAGE
jgi:hypothetical protein